MSQDGFSDNLRISKRVCSCSKYVSVYRVNRLISLKGKYCFTSLGDYVSPSPSLFLVSDRFRAHVWHPSTLDSRGSSSVFHRWRTGEELESGVEFCR